MCPNPMCPNALLSIPKTSLLMVFIIWVMCINLSPPLDCELPKGCVFALWLFLTLLAHNRHILNIVELNQRLLRTHIQKWKFPLGSLEDGCFLSHLHVLTLPPLVDMYWIFFKFREDIWNSEAILSCVYVFALLKTVWFFHSKLNKTFFLFQMFNDTWSTGKFQRMLRKWGNWELQLHLQ